MWIRMASAILAGGAALVPLRASAQDEPILTVQVQPGSGVASLPVTRSLGDLRQVIGTATSGTPLRFNMNNANIGKGQRVSVNTHQGELVLIEEGTTDRRCEEARQQPRESWCQEVAVLTWGTAAEFGVSGTAGALQVTTRRPPGPARPPSKLGLGLDLAYTNFFRLADVACDETAITGLTACDAEATGVSFGVRAELRLTGVLAAGIGYTRAGYAVNQHYGAAAVRHDVTVNAIDFYGMARFAAGPRVRPFGILGFSYYDNSDDVSLADQPYLTQGQGGPRMLYGAGVELGVLQRVDLRALLRYGGGAKRDADSNLGFGVGVYHHF